MNSQCPIPPFNSERVLLGHGGGGLLSQKLLKDVIAFELKETLLPQNTDATYFNLSLPNGFSTHQQSELSLTTDSFVVDPIFFPGGDIGKLSIVGTVNDLAMMGCYPQALSLSFILEEGFLISDFIKILKSIRDELLNLNIKITCGDTKVVPCGKADKIYINTTGVGIRISPQGWRPQSIQEGDQIIISRDIACHGLAILNQRNNLGLSSSISSDCHELLTPTMALIQEGLEIHCARDLTRGGLVSAIIEIASVANKQIELNEELIPKSPAAQSAAELLGLDLLAIANEGTCIYFLPKECVSEALKILCSFSFMERAAVIGSVGADSKNGRGLLRLPTGLTRNLKLPPGEVLPRIC